MVGMVRNIVEKVQSRKLGVTAMAGVAAGMWAVDITWPIAATAMAYILGQAYVDGRGRVLPKFYRYYSISPIPMGNTVQRIAHGDGT